MDDRSTGITIKWENNQLTGSFKARGAFCKVLSLDRAASQRGLVCASAGNHGAAVALAAAKIQARVDVFVGENAAQVKVAKMRALGAHLHVVVGGYAEAETSGRRHADETGKTWVSPYDDLRVIAGQATTATELLGQHGSADSATWVVPLGGGGLIAGIGFALKVSRQRARSARLIGVQPADNAFMNALYRGQTQDRLPDLPSLADGLTGAIDTQSITIPMMRELVDDIVLVSEDEIAHAIAWAWRMHEQVIEGSGAVSLAALLSGRVPGRPAVAIISGGNIDPDVHIAIVARYGPGRSA
jgi:threonine dehydratase